MKDRALSLFVVVASLLVLVVPAVNMVRPFLPEAIVYGVEMSAPEPHFTAGGVFDETFQKQATPWFEQHYGVRAWATLLDNSIPYYAFGELPPDKPVRVGSSGVLFLNEQLYYYNRSDTPDVAAVAAKVRAAQDALARRGKVLLVTALPAKVNVWPEDVPQSFRLPIGYPRPSDVNVGRPYVKALQAAGVNVIDGRTLAAERGLPREAIYTRVGRHLASPPACLAFEAALALARPKLPNVEIPVLDCRYDMRPSPSIMEEELDLLRISNIWHAPYLEPVPFGVPVEEKVPKERRANLLVVGSSFGWKTIFEAERNKAFRDVLFHYYGVTLVVRTTPEVQKNVKLGSDEWRAIVESSDVIVLPWVEEYMPMEGSDFIAAVTTAYGTEKP